MTDTAICAHQLTQEYADCTVVDRFDLAVPPGIVLSLLGPDGGGKTTIVRMLATLSRHTSGTAKVFSHDIRTSLVSGAGVVQRHASAARQAAGQGNMLLDAA